MKTQLTNFNWGARKALSREQMREVVGGGYYPCKAQCFTDSDCPELTYTGTVFFMNASCKMTTVGGCHNTDGSLQPPMGVCVYS